MDLARAKMMDRLRKAALPAEKQEDLARIAIRDAQGSLALAKLRQEKGEETFDLATQVARAVDRWEAARDDAASPFSQRESEGVAIKKNLARVRSEVSELVASLQHALEKGDPESLVSAREALELASTKLSLLIEA